MANYIISSGQNSSGIILNDSDTMEILDGGIASTTTVNSGGSMTLSGGIASTTTVSTGGHMILSAGTATASDTTIRAGSMTVFSGIASRTTLMGITSDYKDLSAIMTVSYGSALETTVGSGTTLTVESNGTASATTVDAGGFMHAKGSAVFGTTVFSGGFLNGFYLNVTHNLESGIQISNAVVSSKITNAAIYAGQSVSSADVNAGGIMTVSGGSASLITVNGAMTVAKSAAATETTISSGGTMTVSGQADSTTVSAGGTLNVSGGTLTSTTVHGSMSMSGGSATSTSANGNVTVIGGKLTDTTVNSGVQLRVSNGGAATSTTVNANGNMTLIASGKATVSAVLTTVSVGGSMLVSAQADALGGGPANATVTDTVVSGNLTLSARAHASSRSIVSAARTAVCSGGNMRVLITGSSSFASGVMTDTEVNGNLTLSAVGSIGFISATKTTVNSGGSMSVGLVSSGSAAVTSTTVNAGGIATLNGTITSTTVGGNLTASGTLSATNVLSGASAKLTGNVSQTTVKTGGIADFSGTLNATTLEADTLVNGFTVLTGQTVSAGLLLSSANVLSGHTATLYRGWGVTSTTISDGGSLNVVSGNVTSAMVESGGILTASGGTASAVTVGGSMTVSGGSLIALTVESGSVNISGGTVSSATLTGGSLATSQTTVQGDLTVGSGAQITITDGTLKADGTVLIEEGGMIDMVGTCNVYLWMEGRTPDGDYLVSDWSRISGAAPAVTLYIDDNMALGTYKLAQKVGTDLNTITVKNLSGENFGKDATVTVGGTPLTGYTDMTVKLERDNDGNLTLTTNAPGVETITARPDSDTPTNQDVTVTATFTTATVTQQYSRNNTDWQAYTDGVVLSENGTVYFRGLGSYNNPSEVQSITVDWIDKTPPVITLTGNNQTPVQSAVLTASTDDGSAIYYSTDNTGWTEYTGELFVNENLTYYFKATDAAGNEGTNSITFGNIDTTPPEKPTAAADITTMTNQDVTVTATFSDDTATPQYSRDNQNWQAYTAGVVMPENGTVYFRGIDEAGNISEVTEFQVNNIDKTAPEKPTAAADITTLTNQDVTVTATFSDDSVRKEYSLDGTNWEDYTTGVVLSENGTVYFRGIDEAGNISEVTEFQVSNIDKTPPVITLTGNNQTPVQSAVLTASTDDGSAIYYSTDNTGWTEYTGELFVNENLTYYFKATDAAGNEGTNSITFGNIDTTPPEKPTAAADITTLTNQDVTVTATFSDDTATPQYSRDNQNWQAYTAGVVMPENGTVYFRGIDEAGNISEVTEYAVTNIDKTAPEKPAAAADITVPTQKDVTVTATFSEDSVRKEYSRDNKNWNAYTSGVVLSKNGQVYFRGIDEAGNISEVTEFKVSNIDRTPPDAPRAKANITAPTNQEVTVRATFSTDSVRKEYSLDGTDWKEYVGGVVMPENGTVYFRAIDEAGNISEVTGYAVTNIDKTAPDAPAAAADITAPTNRNVTVTAAFSEDSVRKEYSLDNQNWQAYTAGVVMPENGTVYFRGTDAAGNISEVTEFKVSNIDKTAPEAPAATQDITEYTDTPVTVTAVFSGDSVIKEYSLDDANWQPYTEGVVLSENGTVYFRGTDAVGNISGVTSHTVSNIAKQEYVIPHTGGSPTESQTLDVETSGWYQVNGDFGDITGTVTIYNGGKKIASGSVRQGVLTIGSNGNQVLLDGALPVTVQIQVKNGSMYDYSMDLKASNLFLKEDHSDDRISEDLPRVTADKVGEQLKNAWVGFGDEVDYLAIELDHATDLSLDLTATDATKFTLYNAAGKSVLTSSLKAGKALSTKPKLLDAGQYYLQVLSTNAKKGGSSDYTVAVGGETTFLTKGDNSDDTYRTAPDLGTLSEPGQLFENWVGYGDAIDFRSFTVATSSRLKFTVKSTDSVKLMVYQDIGGKLKSLGNVSVKPSIPTETRDILLTAGKYYLAVQSTNAKKGGNADYSVTLNGNSQFFPAGDNTNDTWQAAAAKPAKLAGEEITGWVGYGDAKDFIKFQLAGDGQVQLDLDGVTANAYASKQIKLTCLDANGKSVGLTALDGDTLISKKPVSAGEYYLGVTCANVKKYDTSYSVTTGLLATA